MYPMKDRCYSEFGIELGDNKGIIQVFHCQLEWGHVGAHHDTQPKAGSDIFDDDWADILWPNHGDWDGEEEPDE